MAYKCFLTLFIFIVTWAYLTETTFSAPAGWCYQCDSRNPNCQVDVNAAGLAYDKTPCNGQCYIRVKDGQMSRGCSWEYGFMTKQLSYTPVFEQNAMWIFCDTALCNADANTG